MYILLISLSTQTNGTIIASLAVAADLMYVVHQKQAVNTNLEHSNTYTCRYICFWQGLIQMRGHPGNLPSP